MPSQIEWTDETWNPVTGCTPVSEGCKNCYAARMAKRLAGRAGYPKDDPFRVTRHADKQDDPLHWRKPRRVFVCSMGDLFHEDVPDAFIYRVLEVILLTPRHTYQMLTKRPGRMAAVLGGYEAIPNLWLGVTAENQQTADERIPLLLQTPAAVRFVSIGPMLGPIDVSPYLGQVHADALGLPYKGDDPWHDGLDWVICGGETGPGARPMNPKWVRDVRDQCMAAGVPFFFKGWGAWFPDEQLDAERRASPGSTMLPWAVPDSAIKKTVAATYYRVGKKRAGRLLDGREWNELPKEIKR